MLTLDGAEELRRWVKKKWWYRIVRTRINEAFIIKDWQNARIARSYVAKFLCPTCGADAVEIFIELEPEDPEEMECWAVGWRGKCSHIAPGSVVQEACVCTLVEEGGVVVGSIEPVSPPEWPRYEGSGDTSVSNRTCACFGTLWQAIAASLDECRYKRRRACDD